MTDHPTEPRIPAAPQTPPGMLPLNIFRTLSINEPLLEGFLGLGGHLLGGGVLPDRERELVILRVGFRCRSEYEFAQHTRIGRKAGLTDEGISRLATPDATWPDDDDQMLVEMVDELCANQVVSERVWRALSGRWSAPRLLELLMLAGYYQMVSGVLNSVGVALEPGAGGWPDVADGLPRAPREEPS